MDKKWCGADATWVAGRGRTDQGIRILEGSIYNDIEKGGNLSLSIPNRYSCRERGKGKPAEDAEERKKRSKNVLRMRQAGDIFGCPKKSVAD